jgi:DNA-binding MarR family transcriptional regulator
MKPQPQDDSGNQQQDQSSTVENSIGLRALYALRRIIRAVDIDSRKLVSEHQVTGPQLLCLMKIAENPGITATEIGKAIHLSSSTVVGILDRLEKKQLVERERDKNDRRFVGLKATDVGQALVKKVPYPLRHPLHNALSELSDSERMIVIELLERLVKIMDAQDLATGPLVVPSSVAYPNDSNKP